MLELVMEEEGRGGRVKNNKKGSRLFTCKTITNILYHSKRFLHVSFLPGFSCTRSVSTKVSDMINFPGKIPSWTLRPYLL